MSVKKVLLSILVFILVLGALGGWMAYDVVTNDKVGRIKQYGELIGEKPPGGGLDHIVYDLSKGKVVSEEAIISKVNETTRWMDYRFDTVDFRYPGIIRMLYDYRDHLPEEAFERLKETLLSQKYWMTYNNEDGICFWSENHQLLFSTGEYLIGHYFEEETFSNDQMTGAEHRQAGKERVLTWLEQRWLYGFTEFYSNTYYIEDIGPLAVLIDFAPDEEVREKAKIVMDLLLFDVATQQYKGTFTTASGRMYTGGKQNPGMTAFTNNIWTEWPIDSIMRGMDYNLTLTIENGSYKVPDTIMKIGYDTDETIIKASTGLNLSDLKSRDLIGFKDNQIMMQWAMESFSNPEVVTNTMKYINKNNMMGNQFLNDFKMVNITFLRELNLLPAVSNILQPRTNGVSIQRGNVYTFKNNDFFMATAQNHQPGGFADQQHVFSVTMYEGQIELVTDEHGNQHGRTVEGEQGVTVYHTHPTGQLGAGALGNSPGYWVGHGRFPHSVQEENVNLSIYKIPEKKGFMEDYIYPYTHAYLPKSKMELTEIEGNYAFGKEGDTYIALIGASALDYGHGPEPDGPIDHDEIVQYGDIQYWITEVSSKAKEGSYEAFKKRIKSIEIDFNVEEESLHYQGKKSLALKYQGDFSVDGLEQDLEYKRFDSKYAQVDREPRGGFDIEFDGSALRLDFYNWQDGKGRLEQ